MLSPNPAIFNSAFKNVVLFYNNGLLLMKDNTMEQSKTLRKSGISFTQRKHLLDKLRWIELKKLELQSMPMPALIELVDDKLLDIFAIDIHPTVEEIQESIIKKIKNFDIIII